MLLRETVVGLFSLLAPRTCVACPAPLPPLPRPTPPGREWAALLCPRCRGDVRPIGAACPSCAAPRPAFADPTARCRACVAIPKRAVTSTIALLRYRGVVRRVLHRVKYAGREEPCAPLGAALAHRVREVLVDVPADLLVVPVPLHLVRRCTRGFNQAERIAEGLARVLDRPLAHALARRRSTRPLYGVKRDARDAIVGGAFRATRVALAGRPVLLVDDIRTSGATLRAAAEALQAAGASRVIAAVVAR